jgi:hypothetical protein
LGHATPATTAGTYAHALQDARVVGEMVAQALALD